MYPSSLTMNANKSVTANFESTIDLQVSDIEINQAVREATLVAGKPAVVRLYLDSGIAEPISNVSAVLYVDNTPLVPENEDDYVLRTPGDYSYEDRIRARIVIYTFIYMFI